MHINAACLTAVIIVMVAGRRNEAYMKPGLYTMFFKNAVNGLWSMATMTVLWQGCAFYQCMTHLLATTITSLKKKRTMCVNKLAFLNS